MDNLIEIEITDENVGSLQALPLGEVAEKKINVYKLNKQISDATTLIDDCRLRITKLTKAKATK